MKTCLAIAGSDCSGGAGIQADLKAFSANRAFGMSVIASVVAENTSRVLSVFDLPVSCVESQIDAVFEDITVDAVKIGMLSNAQIMQAAARRLEKYRPPYIVLDPVMTAKGGSPLMEPQALAVLKEELVPLCALVTPNLPEAQEITGDAIRSPRDMKRAAVKSRSWALAAYSLKAAIWRETRWISSMMGTRFMNSGKSASKQRTRTGRAVRCPPRLPRTSQTACL